MTGRRFAPERFTGLIALRLAELLPGLELAPVTDAQWPCGRWALNGHPAGGLLDDVIVLEHVPSGAFRVVDFQDSHTVTHDLSSSPKFRGAAVMMYHPPTVRALYGERSHLIGPGWFTDQEPEYVRGFREQVAGIRCGPLDPRLFFRGTIDGEGSRYEYKRDGRSIREAALVLREKYPDEVDVSGHKLPRPEWLLEAARHLVVLTLPGHPWCYREFEMMNLGIPILTYRWTSFLYHQPVYYVPVDGVTQHPIGFALDPEQAADAIIHRYRAVRGDRAFLDSVARRAQAWYDRHWTPRAIAEDMLTFFDLPSLTSCI